MTGANRKLAVKTLLTGAWMLIASVYLFPYVWMVLTGIRRPVDTLTMPPRFIFTPSLEGFAALFREVKFQSYLFNSIVVAVSVTLIVATVAGPAAYALTHLRMRGRRYQRQHSHSHREGLHRLPSQAPVCPPTYAAGR